MEIGFDTAEVFLPLLEPARYKGAHGGRGSGKTQFFGGLAVEYALTKPGFRMVCVREVQKTLSESSKQVIEQKIHQAGVERFFDIQHNLIRTPGGGGIIFIGMRDHNADSIKSLEGFDVAWMEEAQAITKHSLSVLRPTIRKDESEIWASWNPRKRTDAIDEFLRSEHPPESSVVVQANWRDNPWFTKELEAERLHDLKVYPELYPHIWEGDYASVVVGAYYSSHLLQAQSEGRICPVVPDPILTYRVFVDIGGTGAKADAFTMWVCQFRGRQINVIDYYETQGQPMECHLNWLKERGYRPGVAKIWLPHDGAQMDKVFAVSYQSAFQQAGFDVVVVPNQGRGAAAARIEAGRRHFGRMWFDEERTRAGREALGYYHERKDPRREIGLGPEHDWSSHAADSFGLMAICYEEPESASARAVAHRRVVNRDHSGGRGWMAV